MFAVFAAIAAAQIAPVQTTLVNQVTAFSVTVTLASASGISAGNLLFVEREAMLVQAVTGNVAMVIRGSQQTTPVGHVAGSAVNAGPMSLFSRVDPTGYCSVPVTFVLINLATGNSSACTSNSWVTTLYGASGGGGGGAVSRVFGRTGAVQATSGDYSFSQLSGVATAAQTPALTGDVTKSAGSAATTVTAIQGKAVSTTAPTDGQILGYSATAGNYLPLTLAQQLDSRPLSYVYCKPPNQSCGTAPINSSTTVATLTGPGTMTRFEFGSIPGSGMSTLSGMGIDGTISVVADGTTVINAVPFGIFCAMYGYNGAYSGQTKGQFFSTRHIEIDYFDQTSQDIGCGVDLFINYATSLTVSVGNTATSGGSASVYTGVEYRAGTPPVGLYNPRFNKYHSYLVPISTTVSSTQGTAFTILPTQTPGSAGLLWSIRLFEFGVSSCPSWMEGHPAVTIDGTVGPTQGGTEDFFGNHFYGVNTVRSDEKGMTMIGTYSGGYYYTGMYRFFEHAPAFFNTSLGITSENGHAGETGGCANVGINVAAFTEWYTVQ